MCGKLPALVEGAAEQEPTAAILNPVMPSDRPETEIGKAMRVWLDGRPDDVSEDEECRLVLFLWTCCEGCATGLVADFPGSEVKDFASDYLDLIKREKKYRPPSIPRSKNGLTRHMRHVLSEERDPARKELWDLLSEALWELERQGRAKCLGGTRRGVRVGQRNNTKFTQWASETVTRAHDGKPPPADVASFFRKASGNPKDGGTLPHFYPPRASRWHASPPRVIAPKDAEKLTTMLLGCADGWVRLDNLFTGFCKHVHLLEMMSEPSSADEDEDKDEFVDQQAADAEKYEPRRDRRFLSHPSTNEAFGELVSKLANQAWEALREGDLTTVTCQYLLANILPERTSKLAEFGAHSTVFDKKKKAMAILRNVLNSDDFLNPETEISEWHGKLWTETLRCLAHSVKFCNLIPENPDSGSFKQE